MDIAHSSIIRSFKTVWQSFFQIASVSLIDYSRPEIVAYRKKYANTTASQDTPDLHDRMFWYLLHISDSTNTFLLKAAFRVLVEENVKANVNKIAKSAVMQKVRYTPLNPLFIQTFFTRQWPALHFNGWSNDYPKQLRTRYGGLRSRMGLRHWKWPSFWFGCVSRSTWQGNPINSFPHYAMKKSTRKGKTY